MSTPSNPFAVAAAQSTAVVQTAQGEIMQQLQAGFVMAAKRPRDQHLAFQRIIESCKRRGLAEEAVYMYSRGGTQITGASIRLLEAIFVAWGNVQSGVIELNRVNGESQVMTFAIDLETNCYDSKIFSVKHERYTKAGTVILVEERDIYEHIANFAARRKRACMEAVIPRDIVDSAIEQCDLTLKTGHTEPITDRVRKIATAFAELGVTVEMLERRLQHKLEATIEQEVVLLRKIYTSIKDGMGKREDFFDLTAAPKPAKFEDGPGAKTKAADEQAEAAAGLAPATPTAPPATVTSPPAQTAAAAAPGPATPPAPAMTPAARMAKARAAKAAKDAEKAAAPPVAAQTPTTAPVAPAPAEPGQPAADLFQPAGENPDLTAEIADVLLANNMTEAEVLNVLKQRQIADPKAEKLLGLPQEILQDLIENAPIIAAQVRIDRRAKK